MGRMLRISMSSQVNFSLESFFTKATTKGLVAGMFSHMSDQIAALRKGFPAHHALVRLLAFTKRKLRMKIKSMH